jgi:hypothetical protein
MPRKAASNTLFTLPQSICWWFALLGGLAAATAWQHSLRRPARHLATYPTALADARCLPAELAVEGAEFEILTPASPQPQRWQVLPMQAAQASPSPESLEKWGWSAQRSFSIYQRMENGAPASYAQISPGRFVRVGNLQNSEP